MNFLIVLCILAFTQAQSPSDDDRIIPFSASPEPVDPTTKNNAAFFSTYSKDSPICSGAVIKYKWIVTAASCVSNLLPSELRFIVTSNEIPAPVTGTQYDNADIVRNIYPHPQYIDVSLINDIALIEAAGDLFRDSYVVPFIPGFWNSQNALAKGFGGTKAGEIQSGNIIANEVRVTLEPFTECKRFYPNVPFTKLCSIGSRICVGDQGGPLVLASTNELIGIISTPVAILESCDVSSIRPAETYTNIVEYRPWITGIIGGF